MIAWSAADAAAPDVADAARTAYPSIELSGLRYEFDVLTGRERLWDLADPASEPRNVFSERTDDARRMRRALERRLGVDTLDVLREAHRAEADELRRLGYL